MTVPGLVEVCAELDRLRIRYVVVGGVAVEEEGFGIGTQDVDVLVSAEDFSPALVKLRDSAMVKWAEDSESMATVEFIVNHQTVDVDVIDTTIFSGTMKDADAFIRYVRREASTLTGGIRYAKAPVIWYMRLTCPDWEVYAEKIRRDIAFGVPEKYLQDVLNIAERFGLGDEVRRRLHTFETG
jgi:hypothetical protein